MTSLDLRLTLRPYPTATITHFFYTGLTVLTAASLPGGTKPVLIRWYEDVRCHVVQITG